MTRAKPSFFAYLLAILISLTLTLHADASSSLRASANHPPGPTADIDSSPTNYASVADVQAAFSNARAVENTQLGLTIPMMTLPSQAVWDTMDDNARAVWLINRERIDRMGPSTPGLLPLHGTEANVTGIAQYYAQYLLSNNVFAHNADGHDPWERLDTSAVISACHDFLGVAENLFVSVNTENNFPYVVEQAVYGWMYSDAGSGWGHRHAILWYPYSDNSGPTGQEGFLGIGHASGGPYQGPFTEQWPFAVIVVMNVFDPCATWQYPVPRIFMPLVQASKALTSLYG